MSIQAHYAHTNIVARDWRRLAGFYEQVLGGQPGDQVRVEVPGVGQLVFVYAAGPEGNLIELKKWER